EPVTLNKYLYGNGNPVSYTDPSGLFSIGELNAANSIANILNQIQFDNGQRFFAAATGDTDPSPLSVGLDTLLALGLLIAVPLFGHTLRKIPGLQRKFTSPKGRQPIPSVVNKMNRMNICPGTDCSEIAEDLLDAANGYGKIIKFETPGGLQSLNGQIKLLENGRIQSGFFYHEVYTDGIYIYDPLLNSEPVFLHEWQALMQHLNPGLKIP
ncbi:MAG: hypothetical protein J7524_23235, partial [Roseofilum sp. Belize BBD 4]